MDYLKEKQGSRGSSKLVFQDHGGKSRSRTLKLVSYDLLVLAFVSVMILRVFPRGGASNLSWVLTGLQFVLAAISLTLSRYLWKVYSQVWRYSRTKSYLSLLLADTTGGLLYNLYWPFPSLGTAHLIPYGGCGGHLLPGLHYFALSVHVPF